MPIFHNTKTNRRFFFIHIPRTAGRFLIENFWLNGFKIEHHLTKEIVKDTAKYIWTIAEGVEISHTHYSLYNKWKNIKDIPSITVVRNPIDRFFSASGRVSPAFQASLENWTDYKKFFSKKEKHNWWRPQHEFISPHTNIWKYEDGFGKNFYDWINKILSINFSIKTNVYTTRNYDYTPRLLKTTKLIDNVKKFYHRDFKKFDY